jgi:hypothetical protein
MIPVETTPGFGEVGGIRMVEEVVMYDIFDTL